MHPATQMQSVRVHEFSVQCEKLSEKYGFGLQEPHVNLATISYTDSLFDYVFGEFAYSMCWMVHIFSFCGAYTPGIRTEDDLHRTVRNYRTSFQSTHDSFLRMMQHGNASDKLKAYFFAAYLHAIPSDGTCVTGEPDDEFAKKLRPHLQEEIRQIKRQWETLVPDTSLQKTIRSIAARLVRSFDRIYADLIEPEDIRTAIAQVQLRIDAYKELRDKMRDINKRKRYGDELTEQRRQRLA